MEQKIKTCPYCGEEIMATAKKCKHCGEWLTETAQLSQHKQQLRKESYFGSKYLYDKVWMNTLFWVTVVGAFIHAVHQSGITVSESVHSKPITFIRWAGGIPESIGDLLCGVGDIIFVILLMKVFSNFHKPLERWFLAYIIFDIVVALFTLLSTDSQNEVMDSVDVVIVLACVTPFLILPIMIITNYEGSIKRLGWVMIVYAIISIGIGFVTDYIVPLGSSVLIFIVDFFYYQYLRDTLTRA